MKKVAINCFIVLSLWIMVATNAGLSLPWVLPSVFAPYGAAHPVNRLNWYIGYVDWSLHYLGWLAGLHNYWRMFSPVDRFNWDMRFSAVGRDGSERLLPLPHQSARTMWQRNFVDFRDAKFHLNVYRSETGQRFYARYLCRRYQEPGNPVHAIRIELEWQNILPPAEAKRRGTYLDPARYRRTWGAFECRA